MAVAVTEISDVSLYSPALPAVLAVTCEVMLGGLPTRCFRMHHPSQRHCRSRRHVCTAAPSDTLKHAHTNISVKHI